MVTLWKYCLIISILARALEKGFCVPLVFYTITNWLSVSAQISITTCKSTSISRSALSPSCSILFVYYLTSHAALNYIFILLLAALETFLRLTAASSVSAVSRMRIWDFALFAIIISELLQSRFTTSAKVVLSWEAKALENEKFPPINRWFAALLSYGWNIIENTRACLAVMVVVEMNGSNDAATFLFLSVFESRSLFSLRCALTFPPGWCFFSCVHEASASARLSGEKEEISFFTFSSFLALLSCFTLAIFSFLFSSKELQQLSMRIRWIFHFFLFKPSHRIGLRHSSFRVNTVRQRRRERYLHRSSNNRRRTTLLNWECSWMESEHSTCGAAHNKKEKSWISLSRNSQEIKL